MEEIELIRYIPKQEQVRLLLLFLTEISQNWYNAKEMCKQYCTDNTCAATEDYRLKIEAIKERIIELANE